VSPRIITVADTETAVSLQDLYDTLRALESAPSGCDNESIVSAGGKELLGPGVYVGLTVTLLNARLAFAARPGPDFTQCIVSGGNLVALDSVGAPMSVIQTTDYTQVLLAASSSATLAVSGSGVTEQDKLDIADAIWENHYIEGGYTAKQLLRVLGATLAGKLSGAAGSTITIRDVADTRDRIVATVDEYGNRTDVIVDASD